MNNIIAVLIVITVGSAFGAVGCLLWVIDHREDVEVQKAQEQVSMISDPLPSDHEVFRTVSTFEELANQPEILSASKMRYFATRESYENMSMRDLLSVYKTAGTASSDEFYANLLEVLNDPQRHGSPLIHDYRHHIWSLTEANARDWCPYGTEDRRTLTKKEVNKVLCIMHPTAWDHDLRAEDLSESLGSPCRSIKREQDVHEYIVKMADWIMLQEGELKRKKSFKDYYLILK